MKGTTAQHCASTYELGAAGRRVLARLRIHVDAPPEQYSLAYRTFLPVAQGRGYYAVLRDAQLADDQVEDWGVERELAWLAEQLRLAADAGDFAWWRAVWAEAVENAGIAATGLDLPARIRFVRCLYELPNYECAVLDALVKALQQP